MRPSRAPTPATAGPGCCYAPSKVTRTRSRARRNASPRSQRPGRAALQGGREVVDRAADAAAVTAEPFAGVAADVAARRRVGVRRARAVHEPAGRHLDPGQTPEVLGRRDGLVRVVVHTRPAGPPARARSRRRGKAGQELVEHPARVREVGRHDPRAAPALAVDRARQAHDPRAVLAGDVGHGRHGPPVAQVIAQREDEALVRRLDRVAAQRVAQPPVAVHPARAGGLDDELRRLASQHPPDGRQAATPVDVDPQPPGVADVRLGGGAVAAHRGCDEDLVAARGVAADEREDRVQP